MEKANNYQDSVSKEAQVKSLLKSYKHERVIGDYGNWKLKDVPWQVIWNTFSRSKIYLDPTDGEQGK